MIKNYWKQLLVTTYIIVVLVLSATARATTEVPTFNNDNELNNLQKRIAEVIDGYTEPAVFSKSATAFDKSAPLLNSFEDIGYFLIENSNSKLVFVSALTQKIYYVKCENNLKSKIKSDELYVVTGFNLSLKKTSEVASRPPINKQNSKQLTSFNFFNPMNMIYVTGVEIQR